MECLALTCRILYDHDLLEKTTQLIALKAAIAHDLVENNLQETLQHINQNIVHCGCNRCTQFVGGNYPENRVYPSLSSDGYPPLEDGSIAVPVNECLLYTWFQSQCQQFKVPISNDEVDHPQHWPVNFNLTRCLGVDKSSSTPGSWDFRVRNLPYLQQVETIYQMLYQLGPPKDRNFAQWFRYQGLSLLA